MGTPSPLTFRFSPRFLPKEESLRKEGTRTEPWSLELQSAKPATLSSPASGRLERHTSHEAFASSPSAKLQSAASPGLWIHREARPTRHRVDLPPRGLCGTPTGAPRDRCVGCLVRTVPLLTRATIRISEDDRELFLGEGSLEDCGAERAFSPRATQVSWSQGTSGGELGESCSNQPEQQISRKGLAPP